MHYLHNLLLTFDKSCVIFVASPISSVIVAIWFLLPCVQATLTAHGEKQFDGNCLFFKMAQKLGCGKHSEMAIEGNCGKLTSSAHNFLSVVLASYNALHKCPTGYFSRRWHRGQCDAQILSWGWTMYSGIQECACSYDSKVAGIIQHNLWWWNLVENMVWGFCLR